MPHSAFMHKYAYVSVSAGESQAVNERSSSLRRDAIFNSVLPVDELSSWNKVYHLCMSRLPAVDFCDYVNVSEHRTLVYSVKCPIHTYADGNGSQNRLMSDPFADGKREISPEVRSLLRP